MDQEDVTARCQGKGSGLWRMMVQGTVKIQGLVLQLKPITMKLLGIKIPVRDFTRGLHSKQQKKVPWQSR